MAKRAKAVADGATGATEGGAELAAETSMILDDTKGRRIGGRKLASDAIEVVTNGPRKTALTDICMEYILWGHSQKIQIQGVAGLMLVLLRL